MAGLLVSILVMGGVGFLLVPEHFGLVALVSFALWMIPGCWALVTQASSEMKIEGATLCIKDRLRAIRVGLTRITDVAIVMNLGLFVTSTLKYSDEHNRVREHYSSYGCTSNKRACVWFRNGCGIGKRKFGSRVAALIRALKEIWSGQ